MSLVAKHLLFNKQSSNINISTYLPQLFSCKLHDDFQLTLFHTSCNSRCDKRRIDSKCRKPTQ